MKNFVKITKYILLCTLVVLSVHGLGYLACAFIEANVDFSKWDRDTRGAMIAGTLTASVVLSGAVVMYIELNE